MVSLTCLSLLTWALTPGPGLAANVTERRDQVTRFPCRTEYRETSQPYRRTVHSLRPRDVDIVASVGDSITAGAGALANNILEVNDVKVPQRYFTKTKDI